ncbi:MULTISPECIES: hypothetical protein [Spirulina sp. CCY15215]|uniref:hypothetical protein n=1 Tax=Spirulina sp. CCY15215 TaxID=2767591 RepID=UPI001951C746|nr:hypothetical protein [Spirulina major]
MNTHSGNDSPCSVSLLGGSSSPANPIGSNGSPPATFVIVFAFGIGAIASD